MSKIVNGKTFKGTDFGSAPKVHPIMPLLLMIVIGLALVAIVWGVIDINTRMAELQQQQLETYQQESSVHAE